MVLKPGFCQDENLVTVNLPELGYIQGRTVQTMGNRGREPKPYFNFRNIPFAKSVSGPHRFSVRKKNILLTFFDAKSRALN